MNEYLVSLMHPVKVLNLGLPDRFIEHASCDEQLREAGLDVESIVRSVTAAQQNNKRLLSGKPGRFDSKA